MKIITVKELKRKLLNHKDSEYVRVEFLGNNIHVIGEPRTSSGFGTIPMPVLKRRTRQISKKSSGYVIQRRTR